MLVFKSPTSGWRLRRDPAITRCRPLRHPHLSGCGSAVIGCHGQHSRSAPPAKDNSSRIVVSICSVRAISAGRESPASRSANQACTPAASSLSLPMQRHGHGYRSEHAQVVDSHPSALQHNPHGPCNSFPCSTSSRSESNYGAENTFGGSCTLSTPIPDIQIQRSIGGSDGPD